MINQAVHVPKETDLSHTRSLESYRNLPPRVLSVGCRTRSLENQPEQ